MVPYNPNLKNTIYIFIIDDSINDELANLYLMYCQAFYSGLPVKLVKPGTQITETGRDGKTVVKHTMPENFLKHHNIEEREHPIFGMHQLHAG